MVICKAVLNVPNNMNIYYAVLPMPSSGPMKVLSPMEVLSPVIQELYMCRQNKSKAYNCLLPDIRSSPTSISVGVRAAGKIFHEGTDA